MDPYTLFVYGIRSPYTKECYLRRLRGFFDAINLENTQRLRIAANHLFIKEEVIPAGHLIISLGSYIIKRKE
jgi:hypothetical protein